MKREPKYSLREYAEYKGINELTLRARITKSGIDLSGQEVFTVYRGYKQKKNTTRYDLSYLEKILYSVTDGWESKR